jgi:hypothetical protein
VKSALNAQLQGDWESKYDYTMLCLPPGTLGGWIGYAYIGHYLSVFNDQWCTYPSIQLHEIGHNLAMGHSGEGSRSSNQYDDKSGMMGYSYSQDSTKMCFNGAKMWFLGWIVGHAEEVDPIVTPQWSGDLVGVATFSEQLNENVVVKIETDPNGLQCRDCYDFYVAFNRATGFNSGTKEGHNQVLITEQGDGQSNAKSLLVAKLNEGMSYTIVDFGGVSDDSVTVTVNSINLNTGLANISINHSNGPVSSCTVIDFNDFEDGWGEWKDRGSDARRSYNDRAYAFSGDYAIRIRDNTASSSMEHNGIDATTYEKLKVDFAFKAKSMERKEDFRFQVNDNQGSGWVTVEKWKRGTDFKNNQFYEEEVEFGPGAFTLSANFQLRFRCGASSNNDRVYIDDVKISGWE